MWFFQLASRLSFRNINKKGFAMMMEPVKIGVIGCSGYAHQLIIRIQTTPLYGKITAVTSRSLNSAGAAYCRAHGIKVFETVDELLAFGGFEVVINPTPIYLHAEMTQQCLAAGFPVWMEKPPVATVQDLDDLHQASLKAGLPVAVCFNSLFSFRAQQLKAELVAGKYGRIKRIKSMGAWPRIESYFINPDWTGVLKKNGRWVLAGDINNPFAHVVCNGLFFGGSEQSALANPAAVEAELYRANRIESEDTSAIRIQTEEGIEILSWLTLACKETSEPVTVIETEKAVIEFIELQKVKITFDDGTVEFRDSYKENRIEMIEHLCRTMRSDEPLIGSLQTTRPFTLAINAAFDSVGTINTIPEDALEHLTVREVEKQVAITGIREIMNKAFEANALFSEIGVPWAHASGSFDTKNYMNFPVRFRAAAGKKEKGGVHLCKKGMAILALCVAAGAGAATLTEEVHQVLADTVNRQAQVLRSLLDNPYPPKTASGNAGMWHYENFALAAYGLNERTDEADEGLLTLRRDLFPAANVNFAEGNFHWHAYLLDRIYRLYSSRSRHHPGRMSMKAENAILEILWEWAGPVCRKELADPSKVWWSWGTENHHAQAWVSFWGAAQIFKDHPDYQNRTYADGSTPAEMAAAFDAYFKVYARERASKGLMWEIASPGYSKYTLNAWYNLADFADDPVLKKRMDMLLNVYWTDWAIEQINGVRGGSRHRSYAGRGSAEQSGGAESAWYHFGKGIEANKHPGAICAATTFWRPDPVVVALVLDIEGRGEYAVVSRRPGLNASDEIVNFVKDSGHPIYKVRGLNNLHPQGGSLLRTSWCTPDFVAGMSQLRPLAREAWCSSSSQNLWNGVIFAGHPTARIFTQPYMPKRGSVYNAEWGVQNKGVMILQRLKTSNASGQMIWFDHSLQRVEKEDWVFVEAPQAYAAVRIAKGGGTWKSDSEEQRRSGAGKGIGEWLELREDLSPIIIETVRKKDFASFDAFQQQILANEFSWKGRTVTYRSTFYDTTLTLPVSADSLPLVDGEPIHFEPGFVYKSPYLNGEFGSGIVTVQKEDSVLTFDFNKE
jgi:predicted dehydrogenase